MTKVARLYEEEKLEAINEHTVHVAESLIKDEVDLLAIMRATGFSKQQIEKISNNMLINK